MHRDRLVFEAIHNVGYRRLTDEEIVKTQAAKGLSHIARTARKTARKVQCVDFSNLSNENRIQHNVQISMLGAVAQFTKPKAGNAIEGEVRRRGCELPIGDTLKLFS